MSELYRYKSLNVGQALSLLRKGYKITASDGQLYFPFSVMRPDTENMDTCEVSHRAFMSLRKRGLIQMDEKLSRVEYSVFKCVGYAVWEYAQ